MLQVTISARDLADPGGLLELMFRSTHLCIAILDPELRFLRVNQAYADSCKRDVGFFPGRGHFELFPHAENEAIFRQVARTLQPASVAAKPFEHLHTPQRGTTWWDWTLTPIVQGASLTGLLFVLVDVTERVASELALTRSEERFRTVVDHVGVGVGLVDRHGQVLSANRLFHAQFMVADPHVGRPCRPAGLRSGGACPCAECPITAALAGSQASAGPFTVDTRRGPRWFEVRATPVKGLDGAVLYAVVMIEDITQRVELDELRSRNERVEALGLLGGGIAHDFNNLLAAVIGNVSFALVDDVAPAERREALRDAMAAAEVAKGVASQLLAFAKGGEPRRAAVDVAHLLRETVGFSLHGSAVRVVWSLAPDLGAIHADGGQVAQVLSNVVLNARQAMQDKGELRVDAALLAEGRAFHRELAPRPHVLIRVADDGPGIAPEVLRHVFDPYFSTKLGVGSGIGLATAAQIVRRHGGVLLARSEVGGGSVFELALPCGELPVELAAPTAVSAAAEALHVVVVEDEPALRALFRRFVGHLGHDVVVVDDGAQALRTIDQARASGRPFDVAILDLTIPGGMGGLEVVRALDAQHSPMRLIATSGYSAAPVLQDHRAFGFDAVLAKPFTLDEMRRTLASLY